MFRVGKFDTDTKVLRCRKYFWILNPTFFLQFSLWKRKKNCGGVGVGVGKTTPSHSDTTIFGVGKPDTDTDTKVLRRGKYFWILNPTLFAVFSFKTQKRIVVVSVLVSTKPTPSHSDTTDTTKCLVSENLTPILRFWGLENIFEF